LLHRTETSPKEMRTRIEFLSEMKSTNRIVVRDDNTDATETSPTEMRTRIELLLKMRAQTFFSLGTTTQIHEMITQIE